MTRFRLKKGDFRRWAKAFALGLATYGVLHLLLHLF
jgi:hypothetical protein